MNPIIWILIVVAVLIALVGLFAMIRSRQRRGDIFAAPTNHGSGGSQ